MVHWRLDQMTQRQRVEQQIATGRLAQGFRQLARVEWFVVQKGRNHFVCVAHVHISGLAARVPHRNRSSCCNGRRQLTSQLLSSAVNTGSDGVRCQSARSGDFLIAKPGHLPHQKYVAVEIVQSGECLVESYFNVLGRRARLFIHQSDSGRLPATLAVVINGQISGD
jgi:hypothetical protein